jgi:hypothetical protein
VPVALIDGALAWWSTDALSGDAFLQRNLNGTISLDSNRLDVFIGHETVTFVILFLLAIPGRAVAYRILADRYLGVTRSWRDALVAGIRRGPAQLWILVLIDVTVYVAIGGVVLIGFLISPIGPAAIPFLVLDACLAFAFVAWFEIATRLAVPSMVAENVRGIRAIRRSMHLVRGSWWLTLGTLLLGLLLWGIGTFVVDLVIGILANVAVPTTDVGPHAFVLTLLEQYVAVLLVAPFSCAIATVLAIDLRVRKEGLDLDLLTDRVEGATRPTGPRSVPAPRTAGPWSQPSGPTAPPAPPTPWPPPPA